MARRRAPSLPIGLQTTVMVDVLFILLIFFIVVSRIRESNLQVELTAIKKSKQPQQRQPQGGPGLILTIDRAGKVHLDGNDAGGIDGLRKTLIARKTQSPGSTPVVLRTDKAAPSGITVQLVHLLADLGFSRIQFDVLTTSHSGN